MKYLNYDEYINNPLTEFDIENIKNEIINVELKIKRYSKIYISIMFSLSILFFVLSLFSMHFNLGGVITLSLMLLTLISLSRIVGSNIYEKEVEYVKNVSDFSKIEIYDENYGFHDYLGKSSGYTISSINLYLTKIKDKYNEYYQKDYEALLANANGRELLNFEYSILSDKYKKNKFKDLF